VVYFRMSSSVLFCGSCVGWSLLWWYVRRVSGVPYLVFSTRYCFTLFQSFSQSVTLSLGDRKVIELLYLLSGDVLCVCVCVCCSFEVVGFSKQIQIQL
jgi:hypothetical protein